MMFENLKLFTNEVGELLTLKSYTNINEFYKDLKKIIERSNKKKAREELQKFANEVFDDYRLPHIPVYISDKYKIKIAGKFFVKEKHKIKITSRFFTKEIKERRLITSFSIVVFYLLSPQYYNPQLVYDKIILNVLSPKEIIESLLHEIAHYIDYKRNRSLSHSNTFYEIFKELIIKYYTKIIISNPQEPSYEEAKMIMEQVSPKIVEKLIKS